VFKVKEIIELDEETQMYIKEIYELQGQKSDSNNIEAAGKISEDNNDHHG